MNIASFTKMNGVWNCPVMPLQTEMYPRSGIPEVIAREAYKEYVAQFGNCQSLERLNERGGFGPQEMALLLYGRIKRLESADSE